jgi:hypothetical protein
MADIFRVAENDLPWVEYKESVDADGRAGVRRRFAAQRRSWALIVS